VMVRALQHQKVLAGVVEEVLLDVAEGVLVSHTREERAGLENPVDFSIKQLAQL